MPVSVADQALYDLTRAPAPTTIEQVIEIMSRSNRDYRLPHDYYRYINGMLNEPRGPCIQPPRRATTGDSTSRLHFRFQGGPGLSSSRDWS
jgi:hypothetical protein